MRAKLLIKASCSLILCFFIAITSATSDPAAPLVQQAARLAQAIEALDTETMVLMTAPEIVLAFHDESNARAQIESINAALRVYGAKPKVTVGEISTIFGESPRLGALVKYTMAMEVPH